MLTNSFYNVIDKEKRNGPSVLYAGNSISSSYLADLLEAVEGKDISVNVISKSGMTTEPAIAFRIFKELLEKNTVRRKPEGESMPQLTRQRARLRLLRTPRVMRAL